MTNLETEAYATARAIIEFKTELPDYSYNVGVDGRGKGIALVWLPGRDSFTSPYDAETPSLALLKALEGEKAKCEQYRLGRKRMMEMSVR